MEKSTSGNRNLPNAATQSAERPVRAPTRRGEVRRKAFLGAAAELFSEQGYAATTLDMVIERSGGSRATLYALFTNKEGLFEAIIADLCEQVLGPLAALDELDEPPERVLLSFGERLVGVLLSPVGIALFRTVVAESVRMPKLAQTLWRLGPERDLTLLTDYLAHQGRAGGLVVDNPKAAAERFIASLIGFVHVRALMGIGPAMSARSTRRHVGDVVRHFLVAQSEAASIADTRGGRKV